MARSHAPVEAVLDALEHHHGRQHAAGPSDPYEMILFLNCGYPATDASCQKGFAALKRDIGLAPGEILAAPDAALAALMRLGGAMPAERAERVKSIARSVKRDCHGDLRTALIGLMREEKQHADVSLRGAKRLLQ